MLQLHLHSLKLQRPTVQKEMQLQEIPLFDLGVKFKQKAAHFPLHHVICGPTKFEVAAFNGLGVDAIARNVTVKMPGININTQHAQCS